MKKIYHKLVRDKIPDIIREQGETPCTRILTAKEYSAALEQKLDEETAEFHREKIWRNLWIFWKWYTHWQKIWAAPKKNCFGSMMKNMKNAVVSGNGFS